MFISMRSLVFLLYLLPFVLSAEDKAQQVPADAPKKRTLSLEEMKKFYADENDRIVTDWTDSVMREKLLTCFLNAGYVPVMSEAKIEDGEFLFRKAFKHVADIYPDAENVGSLVNSGLTQSAFDEKNQQRQKEGYTIMQVHTFVDTNGAVRISACWARPTPVPKQVR